MKTKAVNIAQRLRTLRLAASMTPEELAKRAGLHWQTIRKLESGERSWGRLDTARKIASALDIPIDVLLNG